MRKSHTFSVALKRAEDLSRTEYFEDSETALENNCYKMRKKTN